MPGWRDIVEEFSASALSRGGNADADGIRRKYLAHFAAATGRPAIIYATAWLDRAGTQETAINLQDVHGFMEACRALPGPDLDIILHSPGGTAEGAASIVHYLRQKYSNIRVFVPLAAMSAATMWAMAADRIVMGKHSQLGPIDPQFLINDRVGTRFVAASAILDQFKQAKAEIAADGKTLGAWAQILPQYGPGLLQQCETATALAKSLVREWLAKYMLAGDDNRNQKANDISEFLGTHSTHQSHNVGIFRDRLREYGLIVDDLENTFQDEALSVFHATIITFKGTQCVKLIENNQGRGYYQMQPPPIQFLTPQIVPQGAPAPARPAPPTSR